MRILFLPCYYDGLPQSSGSVRIRCRWIAQNWDEADVYDGNQQFSDYNAFVFQKLYLADLVRDEWLPLLARWRDMGRCVLAFDLCDPDYLDYEHERRMLDALPRFDFAVATTEPIAQYLRKWLPTWVIPDRIDVSEVERLGAYSLTRKRKPSFVWAGYEHNTSALAPLLQTVKELQLPLDVLAFERPVTFEEFWSKVLRYDVLLNPQPDRLPFSAKSDNKTLIAWTLGMPVAKTAEEIVTLCDPKSRARASAEAFDLVREKHDISRSVKNWRQLLGAWGVR